MIHSKFSFAVCIIFLCFINEIIYAQINNDYHSFNGVMYIPIIVDYQEELNFKDGTKKQRDDPEKKLTIQVNMNTKNMQINKGVFSGMIVRDMGSTRDEVVTFKGKISKNQQKLEYIEITNNVTVYRLSNRENIEKTISLVARFENIPKSSYGNGFKYKYGISKIASVEYLVDYTIPRSHYVQNYTESFVKIDEEQMGDY
ncbi:MAG: hypothetical protein KUG68_06515 [Flavobacteriaceae bacterium]|nr:hypothetical protein [Flavobacteriaceae bacterium]